MAKDGFAAALQATGRTAIVLSLYIASLALYPVPCHPSFALSMAKDGVEAVGEELHCKLSQIQESFLSLYEETVYELEQSFKMSPFVI